MRQLCLAMVRYAVAVHPKHSTESEYAWIETGTELEIQANTGCQRININGAINVNDITQVVVHECNTINALTTIVFLSKIEFETFC